ncbi:MAG: SGNH/GDSL hydrolase family protein [Pseudomonadota bacterium]
MVRIWTALAATCLTLSACTEAVPTDNSARILAMGDSMMAWNSTGKKSVSHNVERLLGEPVVDRSVSGARMLYAPPISGALGLDITQQYQEGDWDWVIVNGGGNDLWMGCGCRRCDTKIQKLIGKNGAGGTVPGLISKIRARGARVVYVGYLRSPGVDSMIDHCGPAGDEFERRVALMADADPGVYFVSLADLVPHGDRSYHKADMVHPTAKASRAIAERVTRVMR